MLMLRWDYIYISCVHVLCVLVIYVYILCRVIYFQSDFNKLFSANVGQKQTPSGYKLMSNNYSAFGLVSECNTISSNGLHAYVLYNYVSRTSSSNIYVYLTIWLQSTIKTAVLDIMRTSLTITIDTLLSIYY